MFKQSELDKISAVNIEEIVHHFRDKREELRTQWVDEMNVKELLKGLSAEEFESESAAIYDTCVECLATGNYETARTYATKMAVRDSKSLTPGQILGGMLTLRDVYGRSLFARYQNDIKQLKTVLDIYETVANNIISIVALAFIEEREKTVKLQQEAIRELSTPVLQVREGMLILPIIGAIDALRARQLTEQLLRRVRVNRAKVVVVDITGVPSVDTQVANHLLLTVDACRLMGAAAIITGLSAEVAQTLVNLRVDFSHMRTIGDLQGGIEEADRLLGYETRKRSGSTYVSAESGKSGVTGVQQTTTTEGR